MSEEQNNADEALNRNRFKAVKDAMRMSRCEGTCKVHPLMVDGTLLVLEGTEALLVDMRNIRVQLSTLTSGLKQFTDRQNAMAGEQVEQHSIVEQVLEAVVAHPKLARGGWGSTVMWVCLAVVAVSAAIITVVIKLA